MVIRKTGQLGTQIPAAGLDLGGQTVRPASGLRTWVQRGADRLRLVAELPAGRSEGVFPDVVPEDWALHAAGGGSLDVRDPQGRLMSRIDAPWALDANGRELPTRYVIDGRSVRQLVDTRGAAYPVVIDPSVQGGWWYFTPGYYVKYDWSGTWRLKTYINDYRSLISGLVCNFVPNVVARTTCAGLFIYVRSDMINTINSAIAHKKCFKVRLPASGGAAGLPAYDSYYVTC
jgi:hypothetical protein